jgi:hypothetical protein
MKLLVDADSIAYKLADKCLIAGSVDSKEFEEEEGFAGEELTAQRLEHHTDEHGVSYVVETSIDLAKELVQEYVDEMLAKASVIHGEKITDYVLYLTAGKKLEHIWQIKYNDKEYTINPCFRYEVAEVLAHGYKHNRISRPLHGYITIMEAMALHFNSIMVDYIEADDIVVALKNHKPDEYFLAAMDKDVLNQAVGTHLNYGKLSGTIDEMVYTTTDNFAIYYKYYQAIVGDPTDGYKGVPGIGKVGAGKLVSPDMTELELFNATLRAFESKGLGMDECIATLRLADMTQVTAEDEHNYKVKLYERPVDM